MLEIFFLCCFFIGLVRGIKLINKMRYIEQKDNEVWFFFE